MIEGKIILGIIPARGGSKGIPRKNIRCLAGKPLIAWTIEEARKSKYIDRLILSSEDDEIIKVAREWGCEVPFVRPAELAGDDVPGSLVVIHAMNTIVEKYDYIVLLQVTSPLRTVEDIDNAIRYCIDQGAPVCASVCLVQHSPYWMHTVTRGNRLRPLIKQQRIIDRRQDLPEVYMENGAVCIARTEYLLQHSGFITQDTLAYIMPRDRSLDIDEEVDFVYCELLKSRAESNE